MSKKEPTEVHVTEKTEKDIFDTWFELYTNAIDEASKIQAQYAQTLTSIQQECTDACKKTAEAYANIAKTAAHTTWGPVKVPAAITKSITDAVEITNKIANISNKTVISSLELTRQNMKVFNDNIDAFTKLNINFIKTWNSLLAPQRS
ncbi:MAG: hypothetical protein D6752_00155 [Candidatus Nitrosothermus koennekii]|nr:MAG: hypothetical protein D6752_00155 [Candidatus Nitrosothermus koennekii]